MGPLLTGEHVAAVRAGWGLPVDWDSVSIPSCDLSLFAFGNGRDDRGSTRHSLSKMLSSQDAMYACNSDLLSL